MRSNDLNSIIALDQAIFGSYGADESPEVIRARFTVFRAGCAVAEAGEGEGATFAGYLTTEKWATSREPMLDEDPHKTHCSDGQVLNITTLAVAVAYQRQGIGAHLLEYAYQIAKREGCREIILETARAQAWYEQHGFATVGQRIERGIPLFVMQQLIEG